MLHFFYYSLLLSITLSSPLLLYFLFFLYLKRKKEEIIYIFYIYKNWKFDYYTSLTSLFLLHFHSGRPAKPDGIRFMPDTSTAVSMLCLSKMLWAVLVSGRSVNNVFVINARLPERLAGLWE